ncbi:Ubiquitin--protein ligase [Bertholletia excelsa]
MGSGSPSLSPFDKSNVISGEIKEAKGIQFKRFDIVSFPSDHHYAASSKYRECFTNQNSELHKKIMKEWRILQNGLPESIYVRVFEDRIDLLRAVIVGSSGTPYHDGLFFFDIALPSDYPRKPPKVHYHSHGLRLNPNLYASGHVCLSLINTWSGSTVEKWNSSSSTILQVLVSIQGLVLNEMPYFNEPGNVPLQKKNPSSWIDKSLTYNEGVFSLSCKTMLYTIKKPPKGFEGFVSKHFHAREVQILAAISAYRHGKEVVGYYQPDGSSSSSSSYSKMIVSAVFQNDMDILYWDLKKALAKETMKPENVKGERCLVFSSWHFSLIPGFLKGTYTSVYKCFVHN